MAARLIGSHRRGATGCGCFLGMLVVVASLLHIPCCAAPAAAAGAEGSPAAPRVADRRTLAGKESYWLAFCARPSPNILKFPGHCFVVWGTGDFHERLEKSSGVGLFPRREVDQYRSVFVEVPSMLVVEPVSAGSGSLDCDLVVLVDRRAYEESLQLKRSWHGRKFKLGSADCVTFCHSIARSVGLKTPAESYTYPETYVRELARLN